MIFYKDKQLLQFHQMTKINIHLYIYLYINKIYYNIFKNIILYKKYDFLLLFIIIINFFKKIKKIKLK